MSPCPETEGRGKWGDLLSLRTPEVPALWQELGDAQVDLINTDRLSQLRDFLSAP